MPVIVPLARPGISDVYLQQVIPVSLDQPMPISMLPLPPAGESGRLAVTSGLVLERFMDFEALCMTKLPLPFLAYAVTVHVPAVRFSNV